MLKTIWLAVGLIVLLSSGLAQAAQQPPMIKETSPFSVHKTMDRLVDELHRRHIAVFARIDYQATPARSASNCARKPYWYSARCPTPPS